jgi:uncharacterized protein YdeI (YjbR/CyaY-like superfamily)
VSDHPDCLVFSDASQWRSWLEVHHESESEAWLIILKAGISHPGLGLEEAVEEALCFGWIDSTLRSLDDSCYRLRFSPRRRRSIWSIRNVRRAERLLLEGRMTEAGLARIEEAKATGEWDAARSREDTDTIPDNLKKALNRRKGAVAAFRALPMSRKKQLLHWLNSAKRPETEERRIRAILDEVLGR